MSKISVVIPCFNHGEYILEAILSVQSQTYLNWEAIIINDGSFDPHTINILNNLRVSKVQVIHTENNGLSSARNTGISYANGEYILPLDADDKIAPTYMEKAIQAFEQNPDLKLVYCRGRYFGLKSDVIPYAAKPLLIKDLLQYNYIFNSAFYRKKDFIACGGYSEEMKGGWEDWDLWIRLLKNDMKLFQIPEELFFYRVKESSMIESLKSNTELQAALSLQLFVNNQNIYLSEFGNPIHIIREWLQLKDEKNNEQSLQQQVYNTASYRLGHLLLSPLKKLRKYIKI